ncbi:uncharacterized protein LOC134815183 isoform X3 [Bolinopsis microptera]|uniref:uncharacterized protein LOC134815183 isoform X3 n=1 Tax=Bolinopsis microptera TaxID=2820187 RepID=UPI00307AC9A1
MQWMVLLLVVLSVVAARDKRDIEHTPLHKRNAQNALLDVRDTHVSFSHSEFAYDDSVKVYANTSKITNEEAVEITWENPAASLFDMIAIYTPPSRGVKDYLDFRYVSDTKGWQKHQGVFHEILFNMRADYEIRYLAIDKHQKATVKASFKISVPDNEPMHGHIAVTSRPGEIRVMWGSAKSDKPRVKFSQSPDLQNPMTALATTTTYTADDLCGARANVTDPVMYQDPGFFHTALLTDLKPGVTYYYTYGTNKATSKTASFVGAPYPDAKVAVTKFIGYGDMGVYYPPYNGDSMGAAGVTRNLEQEAAKGLDFILHFGDLSYARGRGYIWDQFMTQMTSVSEQVPYMVGVGNHEYDHVSGGEKDPSGAPDNGFRPQWGNYGNDGGGECGVPTSHRYIAPDNGNGVFWYSFNYGLVHVVMFSSEHDFRPDSRQYLWLEKDLKSVDRNKHPWVVVTSHRPLYTSQEQNGDHIVGLHMKLALEELFYNYQVNLHMAGHLHSYESTCAVVSGDCVKPGTGTVYIVVGTSGHSLEQQAYRPYSWSKYHNCEKFGYQRMTANTTHMHVEFVTAPNQEVLDNITIPVWDESATKREFKRR